jgi:transcriptional antiterminator NusG
MLARPETTGNLAQVRDELGGYQVGQVVGYVDHEAISVPLPKRWYILRTAPNREFKVMRRFEQLGLSGYLPTYQMMREFRRIKGYMEWIDRRNVASPLITGAVLVPDFEIDAGKWKAVDGVFGVLRFGDFVPTLTPQLLADIRRIEAIGNTPKSKREQFFEIGQLVRVVSGPFRDFCGRVEQVDTNGRLSVGVEIFSRITPVDLDEGDIEAV